MGSCPWRVLALGRGEEKQRREREQESEGRGEKRRREDRGGQGSRGRERRGKEKKRRRGRGREEKRKRKTTRRKEKRDAPNTEVQHLGGGMRAHVQWPLVPDATRNLGAKAPRVRVITKVSLRDPLLLPGSPHACA